MFNAYQHTRQWPDGGSYLGQPSLTMDVFRVIESQVNRMSERDRRRGSA